MAYQSYVETVLSNGDLYYELERIRRLLISAESVQTRGERAMNVSILTQMFRALLLAKEARQEVVQYVRQDNGGSSENGSPGPAHNTLTSVRIGNVLQKQVPGSR